MVDYRDDELWGFRLRNIDSEAFAALQVGAAEAAVSNKRHAVILQVLADLVSITITQGVVQDDGGQAVMLHEQVRMVECARRRDVCTCPFKSLSEIESNKRFILNDEDGSPS